MSQTEALVGPENSVSPFLLKPEKWDCGLSHRVLALHSKWVRVLLFLPFLLPLLWPEPPQLSWEIRVIC